MGVMGRSAAYDACEQLARAHYENFPVASRLLPAAARPHVAAVYAFARVADDFADEGTLTPVERLALLEDWHARLRAAVTPGARQPANRQVRVKDHVLDAALTFEAVADTIRTCELPVSLFEDLLSAFKQDVTVRRYATWSDVYDYCRRSANPVGRIVLRIAGYRDGALDDSSDALCTALQLTNFWQDLAVDWAKGRLYVPLQERDAAGAQDADLDRQHMTATWKTALNRCAVVTRELFARGRDVCDGVQGRLRLELRATWVGASHVLARLEHQGFDVFTARPSLSATDAPLLAWRLLTWRRYRGIRQAADPVLPGR
jgi:squalene synthase HpnC